MNSNQQSGIEFIPHATPEKIPLNFSIQLATPSGKGKRDKNKWGD
jgi:hypothetical protein